MKIVVLAWLFFMLTGVFVSIVVPLGEGIDEPWHLGYLQYLAETGKLPPGPKLHLSAELQQFFQLHPVGWMVHTIYPDLVSQEEYWRQPEDERLKTDAALRRLHFLQPYSEGSADFTEEYESHQPPLYYGILAPLFIVTARSFSLADTFLLMRLWSVLIASAVVPLSYCLAKRVTASPRAIGAVTMLVAMFPGMYPDVVRVSTDALLVPVAAAIFLALMRYLDSRSGRDATVLGLMLLIGLSTKAFLIPVLAATLLIVLAHREFRTAAVLTLVSAAGWAWYARNIWITGSLTGLPQTVVAKPTLAASIASLRLLHWVDMIKLTAVSHIWIGNFSLLQFRSWMYKVVELFVAAGGAGFVIASLRKRPSQKIQALLLIYAVFAAALVYFATQIFLEGGVSVIQGWYLTPMLPIEALVFVLGIQYLFPRKLFPWVAAFMAFCFLALVIYGNAFISAPYYSGLTRHSASGRLSIYSPHWQDIAVMSGRLTRFHSWIPDSAPVVLCFIVVVSGISLIWVFLMDRENSVESQL